MKSFLQKERQRIFREITKQYQEEGYGAKESKKLGRQDTDDVMSDKETFIDNYMHDVWGDVDE